MRKKAVAPYLLCVYYGQGSVLDLLSQTGLLPKVALSPMMEVKKSSGNCNSRSRERRAIGSTRQGQVLWKGLKINVLLPVRLADLKLAVKRDLWQWRREDGVATAVEMVTAWGRMEKTSLGWSHYAEKYGERGFKARYKEIKTFPVLAPQYYGLTLTLTFFPILSALRFNLAGAQLLPVFFLVPSLFSLLAKLPNDQNDISNDWTDLLPRGQSLGVTPWLHSRPVGRYSRTWNCKFLEALLLLVSRLPTHPWHQRRQVCGSAAPLPPACRYLRDQSHVWLCFRSLCW